MTSELKVLLLYTNGRSEPVNLETAFSHIHEAVSAASSVIGIGSPRASLEANYLLKKYVGSDNFYLGISAEQYSLQKIQLDVMKSGAFHLPSLKDVEQSDAILILGEDITNTAPMLALAVRQAIKKAPPELLAKLKIPAWQDAAVREAVQEEKLPLFIAASYPTKLNDVSAFSVCLAPSDIAMACNALTAGFDNTFTAPSELSDIQKEFVKKVTEVLSNAERPLIITGTSSLSKEVIEASVNASTALQKKNKKLSLCFVFPEANSTGLMLLGGRSLNSLEKSDDRRVIINLKNDLINDDIDGSITGAVEGSKLISIDCLHNNTTEKSDIVLPAGTFAESDGTFINNEGRAQRYYQVYNPDNKEIMESWRIVSRLFSGDENKYRNFEDILDEIASTVPELNEINSITPPPGFRIAGQKIPREQHRFSGRTAMHADVNVSEPKPPDDPDSPLTFTMEGYRGEPPSSIIPYFWSPGWNSVQSINKYQIEVGGPLHGGDPGKRLFEKDVAAEFKYFSINNKKFSRNEGEYQVVPVYHIFGSEVLSSEAPAIKEMIPQQFLWMNPDDALKMDFKKDDTAVIEIGKDTFRLPVKVKMGLPRGLAGISVLAGGKRVRFNQWMRITKSNG